VSTLRVIIEGGPTIELSEDNSTLTLVDRNGARKDLGRGQMARAIAQTTIQLMVLCIEAEKKT